MNPQTKDFFASKTTWGMLLVVINQILSHYGLQLPATDETIQSFMSGAGAALFIWGQLTRAQPIGSVGGVALPSNQPKAAP